MYTSNLYFIGHYIGLALVKIYVLKSWQRCLFAKRKSTKCLNWLYSCTKRKQPLNTYPSICVQNCTCRIYVVSKFSSCYKLFPQKLICLVFIFWLEFSICFNHAKIRLNEYKRPSKTFSCLFNDKTILILTLSSPILIIAVLNIWFRYENKLVLYVFCIYFMYKANMNAILLS